MDKQQQNTYWQERITAYRNSGLTMKAWCESNGCSIDQLKYWMYRKQHKASNKQPSAAPVLIPITVTAASDSSLSSLWIEVGSARIEVRPGFEPELLREVVAALS